MSQLVAQLQQQTQQQVQQQVHAAVQQAIDQLLPQMQQNVSHPHTAAASAAMSASPASHGAPIISPLMTTSAAKLMGKPNFFSGALNTNVDTWLFSIEQYCSVTGVLDDASRIGVASSYFKELAATWWYNRCEIERNPPATWADFKTLLKQNFQPIAAARTARANLRYLKQGTKSVNEYAQSFFKQIHAISDMSEADKLHNFLNGLNATIYEEVDRRDPKNLQEAMNYAQATELRLRNSRGRSSNNYYSSRDSGAQRPAYESKTTTISSSTSSNSAPMELGNLNSTEANANDDDGYGAEYDKYLEQGDEYEPDYEQLGERDEEAVDDGEEQLQAIHSSGARRSNRFQQRGRVPNLGREEFIRLMKERKCLRCKKPGHFARNCTQPQQQSKRPNFE